MRGIRGFGLAEAFASLADLLLLLGLLLPVNRMGLPTMRRVVKTSVLLLSGRPLIAEGRCLCLLPLDMRRGLLRCRGIGVFSPSSRSISRQTSFDFSQ